MPINKTLLHARIKEFIVDYCNCGQITKEALLFLDELILSRYDSIDECTDILNRIVTKASEVARENRRLRINYLDINIAIAYFSDIHDIFQNHVIPRQYVIESTDLRFERKIPLWLIYNYILEGGRGRYNHRRRNKHKISGHQWLKIVRNIIRCKLSEDPEVEFLLRSRRELDIRVERYSLELYTKLNEKYKEKTRRRGFIELTLREAFEALFDLKPIVHMKEVLNFSVEDSVEEVPKLTIEV
jgi:hypothetical protein